MKEIEKLKARLLRKNKPKQSNLRLSTGSTLLNLACSGDPSYGLLPGHIYLLVGDSNSGKTWLAHSIFAEAAHNPQFDKYGLVYDNPEDGALMDIARYFGQKTAERIQSTKQSATVEEFYRNVDTAVKDSPCLYILDSMDSLSSEDEEAKFQEQKKAAEKGREVSGSYGTSKAKANSSGCRLTLAKIKKTNSIVVIICQTRDNIGFGAQFNPKTRSGGKALQFYATIELWFSIRERIKTRVRGKDRQQGILSRIHVKRTRITGKEHTVELPIFNSSGIDETGSCIAWLVDEHHWKEEKGIIRAKELNLSGTKETLVRKIETGGMEGKLQEVVASVWQEIEDACKVERKVRYT